MINFYNKVEVFWFKILYILSFLMFCGFIWVVKLDKVFIFEFNVFSFNSIDFVVPIIADPVRLSFRRVMLFIRGSVIFFSNYYIEGEKNINRFSILILLFILSMNFLIFIPNLIRLLIGWDGLGIISFLLVIFYQNNKSLGSGIITFISNRVGDGLLIVSIGLMVSMNSWNIFFVEGFIGPFVLVLWCVVIGAITKRAQIPFSAWLPAAIAAPTPVSALVHSSTLVTAGVYLIIRFHEQVFGNEVLRWYIMVIRTLTTLMAGISAVCETDLKKIIALSTLSQLGVMMFSLSLGLKDLCVFHLFTHALFKALLFMCAGSIIHRHYHFQDIRKLGVCWYYIPVSTTCLNVANLSLCGFPFLRGFYSKDIILESILERDIRILILVLIVFATFLTTIYSARLTYLTVTSSNSFLPMRRKLEESFSNVVPIVFMALVSVFSGPRLFWLINFEVLEPWVDSLEKLGPFLIFLLAVSLVFFSEGLIFKKQLRSKLFFSCSNIWFIAITSTQPLLMKFFEVREKNIKIVDQGWNEVLGGQGIFEGSKTLFQVLGEFQYNKTNVFAGFILINLIILVVYI